MVNSENLQEIYVGKECIKLPPNFKRDREWFRDFVTLNQNKSKSFDEDYEESRKKIAEDDTGAYLMIRNVGFLFGGMGDFNCNKDKKLFDMWDDREVVIKRRIEIINKCLDVYDIIFPFNDRKPVLSSFDLKLVHNLMDRLFYDTAYPVMDETGVDLNMELGCPGWLELKKVLLRFFSKISLDRTFDLFEEEVDGTGHIRPIRREDGSSLKGTGVFLLSLDKEKDEETVNNEKDKKSEEESKGEAEFR